MRTLLALTVGCLALFAGSAAAHFNMLLPQSASAKKGETVTLSYLWGHPFEHQLFDAPQPQSVIVLLPDGKRVDLTDKLAKTTLRANKNVTAYELSFKPQARGDYVFVLRTPPIWMAEDREFLEDTVKVVLHVQVQKGWDNDSGAFEFAPLTRPYGLRPGMVYQAQMPSRPGGSREEFSSVEVEHFNPTPPKQLPADEHITRTVKLDPNGVVTTTLTDPGWWCLTVARRKGMRMHDGKEYPVRERATLWVFVDEPAPRE